MFSTYLLEKTTKFSFIFFSIMSFLSFIVATIVLWNTDNNFNGIFWVPLITSIMYLYPIVRRSKIDNDYIYILIYTLYFVRNTLSIFLFHLADYQTEYASLGDKSDVQNAIWLMCIETIVVFLYLSNTTNYYNNNNKINYGTSKIYNNILYMMLLACVIIYMIVPSVRGLYLPIFGSIDRTNFSMSIPSGGIEFFLYRLFDFFVPILQLLLPTQLISYVVKTMEKNLTSLIFCFMIILIPLLFVGTEVAYSLIVVVALLIILMKMFSKYKVIIIILSLNIILILFLYIFLSKIYVSTDSNNFVAISDTLQAYFPGIINISASFKIPRDSLTNEIIQNELMRITPLRQFIFSDNDYSMRATTLFHQAIGNRYQIMPNISMSYLHIGWFAPIISIFMIFISKKILHTKSVNLVSSVTKIVVSLYFSIGVVMYNFGIVLPSFSDTLIWLLILGIVSSNYSSRSE